MNNTVTVKNNNVSFVFDDATAEALMLRNDWYELRKIQTINTFYIASGFNVAGVNKYSWLFADVKQARSAARKLRAILKKVNA